MRRRFPGLSQAAMTTTEVPDGTYLVRVGQFRYVWHKQSPSYKASFIVLEPKCFAEKSFTARLFVTPRALWKLAWFLRDFGYDEQLLAREELVEKRILQLTGVVKVSHITLNGRACTNVDAFAPAARWGELSMPDSLADVCPSAANPEVA